MIEIKMSQGAKPGHGGILPGAEGHGGDRRGAARRGRQDRLLAHLPHGVLDADRDDRVRRPAARALGRQARRLQDLHRRAPRVHGHRQGDARDGDLRRTSSSSTAARAAPGAAPQEFSDSMGSPLLEGLTFVHNTLVGAGIRDRSSSAPAARWSPASAIATRDRPRRGLVQLGARRSCSRSAASRPSAATRTSARSASPRRTRSCSARSSCPTRPSASTTSTATPCTRSPSSSPPWASTTRASSPHITS